MENSSRSFGVPTPSKNLKIELPLNVIFGQREKMKEYKITAKVPVLAVAA